MPTTSFNTCINVELCQQCNLRQKNAEADLHNLQKKALNLLMPLEHPAQIKHIYSEAKKYLVSHQLCKFSHLKR